MKYQIIFLVSLACFLHHSESEAKPNDKVCEPSSRFKVDCNECKCNTDGTDMACTRKLCPPTPEENRNKVCEPGTLFKQDCNECRCNTDGTDMACTKKLCLPEEGMPEEGENPSDSCTPGESFMIDCNRCTCPPSGLRSRGACTLIACHNVHHSHRH